MPRARRRRHNYARRPSALPSEVSRGRFDLFRCLLDAPLRGHYYGVGRRIAGRELGGTG